MPLRPTVCLALTAACALAAIVQQMAAAQHITVDGSLSKAQTLVGPNYAITPNLGKQVGGNLFHSFGKFGLATSENATFSGPATVSNVIGRVTGGAPSNIDGKIASTIAGASLYLINPSGIVFGPHATVNVSGGFHASTADYLKMSDGAKFQATNPDASTLSMKPPAAFGFLTAQPAKLTVNGSNLGVPSGQTLGLVGGPVSITAASATSITGATLSAPAGTINVTSAAGTGEVPVDPRNTSALTVGNFGAVDIRGGSKLDVGNPGGLGAGGSVFIHAGALTISASEIGADNYGSGPGGVLTLLGKDQIALSNGASVHAAALGSGSGAGIILSTGRLNLTTGAIIESRAEGSGKGGDISIGVADQLLIDGSAGPPLAVGKPATGIASVTQANATGTAGNIMIRAGSLLIKNTGGIASSTFGSASSGNISIDVAGQLAIDQTSATGIQLAVILGIESQANPGSTGNAGDVTINAGALSITNTGQLGSPTFSAGHGGNISVNVGGLLNIDGSGNNTQFFTGIGASVQPGSSGDAGSIAVTAGALSMLDGVIFNGTVGTVGIGTAAATGNAGNITINVPGALSIDGARAGIVVSPDLGTRGNAGDVVVNAGSLSIANFGIITASTAGMGHGGSVTVGAETLSLTGGGNISSAAFGAGNGGTVTVNAGTFTIGPNSTISTDTFGAGKGGDIAVNVAGALTIDGSSQILPTGITALALGSGNAGNVTVNAGTLLLVTNGLITADALLGTGSAGSVTVNVGGALSIDGRSESVSTGITSESGFGTGNAGGVRVSAGSLSISNGGLISASTFGAGNGGDIAVTITGDAVIAGPLGILAQTFFTGDAGFGNAGSVTVNAGNLSIFTNGQISSSTFGTGSGGGVSVSVAGPLSIDGTFASPFPLTGITSQASLGSTGDAGVVMVTAAGLSILNNGVISSTTAGMGKGGSVSVMTPGALVLDGGGIANTQIAASATGPQSGPGGSVTVRAGTLTVEGGAQIASSTAGPGNGGDVDVTVANGVSLSGTGANGASAVTAAAELGSSGQAGEVILRAGGAIALSNGAAATSSTAGAGNGGSVQVTAGGPLSLTDPGTGIIASASSAAGGDAGSVMVTAPLVTVTSGAEISSTTAGMGKGGPVRVTTPGALVLDGAGVANTQIAASATGPQSGLGGSVTVEADTLTVTGGAQIASTTASTASTSKGGDITVNVANGVTLSGSGPNGASGISAAALPGSSGAAGKVVLTADGAIALSNGAAATSSTAGAGNGGSVQVTAGGPLSLTDAGTGIIALATAAANGDAGLVTVSAPQITITRGAEIASTTAGSGKGGSVIVMTPGMLMLDGAGVADTQIAASAIGLQSGPGGDVTVAANALTIEGGARIASSTASTLETGKGGNVDITVASDIVLPDPGPQITARSTGSGDAGSITVSAVRLLMNHGASISTEAETSTSNGGNITLHVRDFLHLVSSEISTSVKGQTGNGGNIAIDPQLMILNHSIIKADAIAGHGGNISITAGQFIPSSDSSVEATSELGISGTIVINGPRVDVNGALVVLSTQLRGRTEVLREACAARADQPISSLVEAGRGGMPQDPEATLPALYIAGRDLSPSSQTPAGVANASVATLRTTARLTMRCG